MNIEDINEFAPVFTRDLYNATVNENEPERVALTVRHRYLKCVRSFCGL